MTKEERVLKKLEEFDRIVQTGTKQDIENAINKMAPKKNIWDKLEERKNKSTT